MIFDQDHFSSDLAHLWPRRIIESGIKGNLHGRPEIVRNEGTISVAHVILLGTVLNSTPTTTPTKTEEGSNACTRPILISEGTNGGKEIECHFRRALSLPVTVHSGCAQL